MSETRETVRSQIWDEVPEADNPFAASICRCGGYDVFGEVIRRAGWAEYLYLLFRGERPMPTQARLLEALAVALANPGPRDHSVRAAMNGGVGGSTNAASLMAALAVGAGELGGARDVYLAMDGWARCGRALESWCEFLRNLPKEERADVWLPLEHPPGFDPNGTSCPTPVRQLLDYLAELCPDGNLAWLVANRETLENAADCPLTITGVAAAAFDELGFDAEQAEMLFLLLRLPGAAVHALEQKKYGWRRYPFFHDGIELTDDPGPKFKETV